MDVRLLIHLERVAVEDGQVGFGWWAESPDVPGYSVAADHLPDLLELAEEGLPIFLDQPVDIQWLLVPNDTRSEGDALPAVDHSDRDSRSIATLVETLTPA